MFFKNENYSLNNYNEYLFSYSQHYPYDIAWLMINSLQEFKSWTTSKFNHGTVSVIILFYLINLINVIVGPQVICDYLKEIVGIHFFSLYVLFVGKKT